MMVGGGSYCLLMQSFGLVLKLRNATGNGCYDYRVSLHVFIVVALLRFTGRTERPGINCPMAVSGDFGCYNKFATDVPQC